MIASTVSTSSPHPNRHPRLRRSLVIVGALAIAVIAALLWYASQLAEHTAIAELPVQERRELYERTLHTLKTTCDPAHQPIGLETFCHDQAEFIVQFPECDRACRALADVHRGPTR
jgi:hypothetical protein